MEKVIVTAMVECVPCHKTGNYTQAQRCLYCTWNTKKYEGLGKCTWERKSKREAARAV